MPKDFKRMPMDSRMVEEISRSPQMAAEQGSTWLQPYGGAQGYQYWARQPLPERLTYFAIEEGYTTPQDIADVTDLSVGQVNSALGKLESRGLVSVGQVAK